MHSNNLELGWPFKNKVCSSNNSKKNKKNYLLRSIKNKKLKCSFSDKCSFTVHSVTRREFIRQ